MSFGFIANIGLMEIIILAILLATVICMILTIAYVIRDIQQKRLEVIPGVIIIVATIFALGPFGLVLYYVVRAITRQDRM